MRTKEGLIQIRTQLEEHIRGLSKIALLVDEQIATAKSVSAIDAKGFKMPPPPTSTNPHLCAVRAWKHWDKLDKEFTISEVKRLCGDGTNAAFYHVIKGWEKAGFLKQTHSGMGPTATVYSKVKA